MSQNANGTLTDSISLKLFVVLRRVREPDRLKDMLPEHLDWLVSQEQGGKIFLSGPLVGNGDTDLGGLTIVRESSAAAALALIRNDPMVLEGVMAVELLEWTVFEGSLSVRMTMSNSQFVFS